MSSNKKLWRIMVGNHEHEAFLKHGKLAEKIKSSIDVGHLEGRAAEIVGIILALAWNGSESDFQNIAAWSIHALKLHVLKFQWPATESVVTAANESGTTIDAEEAELYLTVAKALIHSALEAETGLSFDWYEVQG
jgi:hypothetical protein